MLLKETINKSISKIIEQNIEKNTGNLKIRRKYLDVLLDTEQGIIGIELNANNKEYVHPRNTAYLCDQYSSNIKIKEEYTENINIIQINLTYGIKENYDKRIYYIQDNENNLFVKNFIIYEINMDYYMRIWYNKNKQQVNNVIKYKYLIMLNLQEKELKELIKITNNDRRIIKYMKEIIKLNNDPKFREYISEEDDQRFIQNTLINESEKRGEKRGERRGERRGEKRGMMKVAINLLKEKIPINVISKTTGLSVEKINELNYK